MAATGLATQFPGPGLRNPNRYVTGHNAEGEAVFVKVTKFRFPCVTRFSSFETSSNMSRRTMVITAT